MTSRSIETARRRPPAGLPAALALAAALALLVGACAGSSPPLPTIGPQASAPATEPGVPSTCPTSQPAALPAGETRTVTISTSKGSISLRIDGSLSPIAAGNFVALSACGFYDGVVFHRVATLQDGTPFVIQGGDPTLTGGTGLAYAIQDEPVTATYRRGTLAMARTAAPNSQGSQFFIVLSDAAGPILASYNTYAIFGEVTGGMDVADAIYSAADAELPTHPIAMDSVTVASP